MLKLVELEISSLYIVFKVYKWRQSPYTGPKGIKTAKPRGEKQNITILGIDSERDSDFYSPWRSLLLSLACCFLPETPYRIQLKMLLLMTAVTPFTVIAFHLQLAILWSPSSMLMVSTSYISNDPQAQWISIGHAYFGDASAWTGSVVTNVNCKYSPWHMHI